MDVAESLKLSSAERRSTKRGLTKRSKINILTRRSSFLISLPKMKPYGSFTLVGERSTRATSFNDDTTSLRSSRLSFVSLAQVDTSSFIVAVTAFLTTLVLISSFAGPVLRRRPFSLPS